jgi:1,4-dihydroxy-6-naphthoate synthase
VGRNYGPIVVKKIGNQSPKTKRIGIPGKNTTAFMLLSFYFPGYEPILYRFDQIPEAIQKGEVDFGLLIHEAQLTFKDYGLEKLMDLGVEWMKETGLPIPLGLDVVRKDLGRPLALQIGSALKKSIEVANQQKEKSVEYALKYGRGMKKSLGEDFVGMYVNEDTLDMGQEGEKALKLLFQKALQMKLISDAPIIDVLR